MNADVPIACTLSPDGFTARMRVIDVLAADGLIDRAATAHGVRVRLRGTPEIERRVRELVAAESKGCAILDLTLARESDAIVLEISGPKDVRLVIDRFFQPSHAVSSRSASGLT